MISWLAEKVIVHSLAIIYGLLVNTVVFLFHLKTCFKHLFTPSYSERPPILDDSTFVHHSVSINQYKIHYVTKGNPDDPIIVFLHGFPDFWLTWREQLIEFGSKGYYAVAIDLPGMGESSKILKKGELKVNNVASLVARVIKKSILAKPDQKFVLVGHDWGACVSYWIASEQTNLVSKLVIINGPHPVHFRKHVKASLSQFLKSWYMLFFNSPFWPEYVFRTFDFFMLKACFRKGDRSFNLDDKQLEPWKYIFSQPDAIRSAFGYYRDFVKRSSFLDKKKLPVHQPTLVIWGASDRALSIDFATEVQLYVDHVQVETIPGAGHFVQLEQPEKVSRMIQGFIQ